MTTNTWQTLLETRRFRVVEETATREDGGTASCQYVVHPGSVAILPLVDHDHICLIRNRRLTVQATLLEIPAGTANRRTAAGNCPPGARGRNRLPGGPLGEAGGVLRLARHPERADAHVRGERT